MFSIVVFILTTTITAFADNINITEIVITESDMVGAGATPIENSITSIGLTGLDSITHLKVTTEGTAYLSPSDNEYIKANFTAIEYLDEGLCDLNSRQIHSSYVELGVRDGIYKEFGGLKECTTLKELIIPECAQVINGYSVTSTALTEINIPENVIVIESGAFSSNRQAVGDLIIPDSVEFIGNNAFGAGSGGAINSGKLTLGKSVKRIENSGFINRVFTGDLIIPDSVEYIGKWVFAGGSFANGTWTLGSNLSYVGDSAMSNICSGNSGEFLISKKLKQSDTSFGYNTFDKIIFEEGIETVKIRIARNSEKVKEVILPKTVKTIEEGAFMGCVLLEKAALPSTLEIIGPRVFQGTALKGAFIPNTVTSIGVVAFDNIADKSIIYVPTTEIKALMMEKNTNEWERRFNPDKTVLAFTDGGYFEDENYTTGQLKTPKKDGYIFAGWYDNDRFTGNPVTTATPGTTYYAKWVDSKITFDGNGADIGTTMEPQFADIGENLTENIFTKTGFVFEKWNTASDRTGTNFADKAAVTDELKGDITLYAMWAKEISGKKYYVSPTIADQTYTGAELKPDLYVECDGAPITTGYTVEYTNNTNVGTSTAVVKVNGEEIGIATFEITPATQDISYAETAVSKMSNDTAFTNPLTVTKVFGAITYESSNPAVATVDEKNGTVTILKDGTTTITAKAEGTNNYTADTAEYTLTVKKYVEPTPKPTPKPTPVVTPTPIPQEEQHTPHQHMNLQWVRTETEHWQTCTHCIERVGYWVHDYTKDNPNVCRICGYSKVKLPATTDTAGGIETEEDVAQPTAAPTAEPTATPRPTAEPTQTPTARPAGGDTATANAGLPILPVAGGVAVVAAVIAILAKRKKDE